MDPVRRAAAAELSRIGAVLARAFEEDPAASWALPDPEVRRRRNPRLFATDARNSRDMGDAWTTDNLRCEAFVVRAGAGGRTSLGTCCGGSPRS